MESESILIFRTGDGQRPNCLSTQPTPQALTPLCTTPHTSHNHSVVGNLFQDLALSTPKRLHTSRYSPVHAPWALHAGFRTQRPRRACARGSCLASRACSLQPPRPPPAARRCTPAGRQSPRRRCASGRCSGRAHQPPRTSRAPTPCLALCPVEGGRWARGGETRAGPCGLRGHVWRCGAGGPSQVSSRVHLARASPARRHSPSKYMEPDTPSSAARRNQRTASSESGSTPSPR